jgi:hypothetical protein
MAIFFSCTNNLYSFKIMAKNAQCLKYDFIAKKWSCQNKKEAFVKPLFYLILLFFLKEKEEGRGEED